MNHVIWQLCRSWVKFRRGRIPPRKVSDPVWYFAFGSNMNERLFKERRHMTPLETRIARVEGYRLCFTVVGGRRPGISAPANIVEAPGDIVYGVLYLLPLRRLGWIRDLGRYLQGRLPGTGGATVASISEPHPGSGTAA